MIFQILCYEYFCAGYPENIRSIEQIVRQFDKIAEAYFVWNKL